MEDIIGKFNHLNLHIRNHSLEMPSACRQRGKCCPNDEDVDHANRDQKHGECANITNVIILKGHPKYIVTNAFWSNLSHPGLIVKQNILVKTLCSGRELAVACIQFNTIRDGAHWIEVNRKVLNCPEFQILMQYVSYVADQSVKNKWACSRCDFGNLNLGPCVLCDATDKNEAPPNDEMCTYPTRTIMLNNLSASTTKLSLIISLKEFPYDHVGKIKDMHVTEHGICKEKKVCYLKVDSIHDAMLIYNDFLEYGSPLLIDGSAVTLSFCKYDLGNRNLEYKQPLDYRADAIDKELDKYLKYVEVPEKGDVVRDIMNVTVKPRPDVSQLFYDYDHYLYYDLEMGLHYNYNYNLYYNCHIGKYVALDADTKTYSVISDDKDEQTHVSAGKKDQRKHAPYSVPPKKSEKTIANHVVNNKGGAGKYDDVKQSKVKEVKQHKQRQRKDRPRTSSEGKKKRVDDVENKFCKDIERWKKNLKGTY